MNSLLIVDMQKGFINDNNAFLCEKIENLIKNGKFSQIYATKFVNSEKSQYVKFLNWHKMMTQAEQDFAINLPKDCKIFEKTSYALSARDLQKLKKSGGGICLCGTDYDACVLAIAFQLFDNGIKPYIIIDCVGSHSKQPISKADFEKICVKNFGKDCLIRN